MGALPGCHSLVADSPWCWLLAVALRSIIELFAATSKAIFDEPAPPWLALLLYSIKFAYYGFCFYESCLAGEVLAAFVMLAFFAIHELVAWLHPSVVCCGGMTTALNTGQLSHSWGLKVILWT